MSGLEKYANASDKVEIGAAANKAPDDADYLVGTANDTLTNEIVVGTTPGGSLGGTWASPTIDDLFILNSAADTMTGNLTITSTDPAIILDESAATDTDFWLANISDSAGDDDDLFQIGDGTTVGTNPFLTIDTSGSVGIGTTGPGVPFVVNKDGVNISGDYYATSYIRNAANNKGLDIGYLNSEVAAALASSAHMAFWTNNGSTWGERVRITNTGNVGIGITAPAGKLSIGGGSGSQFNIKTITEEVTIAVGSGFDPVVVTSGNLAPAGSLIMGVVFRVTDAPGGGATTIDIGRTGGGNLDEFIDGASCDLIDETGTNYINGDTAHTGIQRNISAATLTLTTDADVITDEMKVRIVVFYRDLTAPTS